MRFSLKAIRVRQALHILQVKTQERLQKGGDLETGMENSTRKNSEDVIIVKHSISK
jgi:hypothetical protein